MHELIRFRDFIFGSRDSIRDTGFFKNYLFLFGLLLAKEIKIRYKSTVLGYLWALANPLVFMLVYFFAFRIIMRINVDNYASFLLTGLFPWLMISNSINGAGMSLIGNAGFVRNMPNRRSLFPTVCIVTELVHLIVSLPILIGLVYFDRGELVSINVIDFFIVAIATFIFTLPLVIIVAVAACYLRDIEYLVAIFLQLFFWLTPIVYPATIVPDRYQLWFNLNPIGIIIGEWRHVLLGEEMDSFSIIRILVVGGVLMFFATRIWKKFAPTVSDVL